MADDAAIAVFTSIWNDDQRLSGEIAIYGLLIIRNGTGYEKFGFFKCSHKAKSFLCEILGGGELMEDEVPEILRREEQENRKARRRQLLFLDIVNILAIAVNLALMLVRILK